MSNASVTYSFTNGTTEDAPQVNQNFADLVSFANSHLLHKDPGVVAASYLVPSLPRGLVAKATDVTATVGPTSGTTPLDIITAPAFTPISATRQIKVTLFLRSLSGDTIGDVYNIDLKEGATQLQEANWRTEIANVGGRGLTLIALITNPTAASHTYKATITRSIGTGVANVQAGATFPIQLFVEDIGGT